MDLRLLIPFETFDLLVTSTALALLVREVAERGRNAASAARQHAAHHRTLRLTHPEPARSAA